MESFDHVTDRIPPGAAVLYQTMLRQILLFLLGSQGLTCHSAVVEVGYDSAGGCNNTAYSIDFETIIYCQL